LVKAVSKGKTVITGKVGQCEASYTVTVIGLKDVETGITVTNADNSEMKENIALSVEVLQSEAVREEHTNAFEQIESDVEEDNGFVENVQVYDITLLDGSGVVQPETIVDVEIPLEKGDDANTKSIYRIEDDGTATEMETEYFDGKLMFKTEHFSVYVLVTKRLVKTIETIRLNEDMVHICPEKTKTLEVDIYPQDADRKSLIWTSENEILVKVSNQGDITGIAEGTTTIKVAVENTNVSDECTVVVSHEFDLGVIIKEASCEEPGLKEYTCNDCGRIIREDIVPIGHTEVIDEKMEATCTASGLTEGKHCSRCNKILIPQETIPLKEHKFGEWVITKEPTAMENGEKQRICVECGMTEIEEEPIRTPESEKDTIVILKEEIADALANATGDKVIIVIPETDIPVQNIQIPVESMETVATAEKSLTVETNTAIVTLDPAALTALVEEVDKNVAIELKVAEIEEEMLSDEQKQAIEKETKEVVSVIAIEILCNGNTICDFNGGIVTVQIPFTPEEGMTGSEYAIAYVAENGTIEYLETIYAEGCLVVELEHFSEYVIFGKEKSTILLGDANGDGRVNSRDAVSILRYIIKLTNEKFDDLAADINGNGRVDSRDAVQILRKLIGLE